MAKRRHLSLAGLSTSPWQYLSTNRTLSALARWLATHLLWRILCNHVRGRINRGDMLTLGTITMEIVSTKSPPVAR
ncbi:hypothetical protein GALMADRAFT_242252 [Galerina marginata CBS 339.88]|uniref:Uncharacterized protein n=1 Tax=Galerina marginata (strain CBS 339.88) TaxID=685588 RepID=A0A067TJF6_GALM3|nr:hypothetical protein GALMADRAFT_242252 [Galerina marginata CBS 339.88]